MPVVTLTLRCNLIQIPQHFRLDDPLVFPNQYELCRSKSNPMKEWHIEIHGLNDAHREVFKTRFPSFQIQVTTNGTTLNITKPDDHFGGLMANPGELPMNAVTDFLNVLDEMRYKVISHCPVNAGNETDIPVSVWTLRMY